MVLYWGLRSLSLPFALLEEEVEQRYDDEGQAYHSEIVEIVALAVFGETDVAHHCEIDKQNERNES